MINKGGRGTRSADSLRNSGWRPPLVEGKYQDLVFVIAARPEFRGASTRTIIERAIAAFATPDELEQINPD